MKNFDESIRQRIIKEEIHLNPEAEIRFEQAMARARTAQKPKRRNAWVAAVTAVCMIIPLLMFVFQPAEDPIRNGALPTPVPEIIPLMQPAVSITDETVKMHNPSDEIWLVEWQTPVSRKLIWLEPGSECEWEMNETSAEWKGYRVTSDFLHWMDTDADETEQQELMEDAFANGAMILAPGEWENGVAGEMALPLPYGMEGNAVEIYLQSGDLTDGHMAGTYTLKPMPVAVVISVSDTTQPCGLQYADVIYESLISPTNTRMLAVFQFTLGKEEIIAGPVRSVRSTHMSTSNEWGAALVYSASTGASVPAAPGLRELAQPNIGLFEHPQYRVKLEREEGRKVKAPDVWAVDVSAIHGDYLHADSRLGLSFGEYEGGESAESFAVTFTKKRKVQFVYRDGAYQSSLSSYLYKEGLEQTNLSFANVIVMETAYEPIVGDWVIGAQLVGEGRAEVHTGGRKVNARWVREEENSPTRFYDEEGEEILLSEGRTYVAHLSPL